MAYQISSKSSILQQKHSKPQLTTKKKQKSPLPSKSQLFRDLGITFNDDPLEIPLTKSKELRKNQLNRAYNQKPNALQDGKRSELERRSRVRVRAVSLDSRERFAAMKTDKNVDKSPLILRKNSKSPANGTLNKKVGGISKSNSFIQKSKYEVSKPITSKPVLSETLKRLHGQKLSPTIKQNARLKAPLITSSTIKSGSFSSNITKTESKAQYWAIAALEDDHVPKYLKNKIAEFARMEKVQAETKPIPFSKSRSQPKREEKEIKAIPDPKKWWKNKQSNDDLRIPVKIPIPKALMTDKSDDNLEKKHKHKNAKDKKIPVPLELSPGILNLNDFDPAKDMFTLKIVHEQVNVAEKSKPKELVINTEVPKHPRRLEGLSTTANNTEMRKNTKNSLAPENSSVNSTTTHEILKKRPSKKENKNSIIPIVKESEQKQHLEYKGIDSSYLIRLAQESIKASLTTQNEKLDYNSPYGKEIRRVLGNRINRLARNHNVEPNEPIVPEVKTHSKANRKIRELGNYHGDVIPQSGTGTTGTKEEKRKLSKSPMVQMKPTTIQTTVQPKVEQANQTVGPDISLSKRNVDASTSGAPSSTESNFSQYYKIIEDVLDQVRSRREITDVDESEICKWVSANEKSLSRTESVGSNPDADNQASSLEYETKEEVTDEDDNESLQSELSVSSFGDFDEPSPNFLQTLDSITSLSKENDPTEKFEQIDKPGVLNPMEENENLRPPTPIPTDLYRTNNYTAIMVSNQDEIPIPSDTPEDFLKRNISLHWKSNSTTQGPIRQVKSFERIKKATRDVFGLKGTQSDPRIPVKVQLRSKTPIPRPTSQSDDIKHIYLNDRFDYSITNFFIAADLDAKPGTSNLRELSARSYKPPWKTSEFKLLSELKNKLSDGDEEAESTTSSCSDA